MNPIANFFRHPNVTFILGLMAALIIFLGIAILNRTPIIPLWPDGPPNTQVNASLVPPRISVYLPPGRLATGTGILICPAGSYGTIIDTAKGRDVAHWLNSIGIAAFVLDYRHGDNDYLHPLPLQDGQRAIRLIRSQAATWNIEPDRLGIMGFSAGGHLAALVSTHFNIAIPTNSDSIDTFSSRPDFMILVYPVITMIGPYIEPESKRHLLGSNPSDTLAITVSVERLVSTNTPPTLLIHAKDDSVVSVENSRLFYQALQAVKGNTTLHIFDRGGHGFGLGKGNDPVKQWPQLGARWLKKQGLLDESTLF